MIKYKDKYYGAQKQWDLHPVGQVWKVILQQLYELIALQSESKDRYDNNEYGCYLKKCYKTIASACIEYYINWFYILFIVYSPQYNIAAMSVSLVELL